MNIFKCDIENKAFDHTVCIETELFVFIGVW